MARPPPTSLTSTGSVRHQAVWSFAGSYAHAYGGVSDAYAHYGASYAHAYVGSRLAFRGKLVRAQSVAAYKALSEAA